ncbi:hypothetical protein cypCar_00041193 [Cyprinus carpio]|nr:hypothetical protein cypCar_00041193 [Cyprinus carpio]
MNQAIAESECCPQPIVHLLFTFSLRLVCEHHDQIIPVQLAKTHS